MPRNAESLVNFVRSTPTAVAFKGMFTAAPVAGVNVMVLMSTRNESRFVLGGGTRGAAVSVTLSVAVPLPPQFVVQGCDVDLPLQAARLRAHMNRNEAKSFRKFMQPPRQSERRAKGRYHGAAPNMTVSLLAKNIDANGERIVQFLNAAQARTKHNLAGLHCNHLHDSEPPARVVTAASGLCHCMCYLWRVTTIPSRQ